MTEDQFQAKCVMWFDERFPAHRQMLYAVPNGGKRDKETARVMKATGVKPGVADLHLILFEEVVFIELKVNGNTLDPEQIKFRDRVTLRGHRYIVIDDTPGKNDGLAEFKSVIIKLML